MADIDQFLDDYLDHLDMDYTIEHQEGTNRDRIASPEEIAELVKQYAITWQDGMASKMLAPLCPPILRSRCSGGRPAPREFGTIR